jgi:uncharacterized membrane protein
VKARAAVAAAVAAYAAGFAWASILRDRAFETGRFDLGNMVQAVWSTAHGHPLRMTDVHGEQISRLGAHVDPILVAFAPLWWVWPSASMLLSAQAAAIALGALPVYWLARKHLGSELAAVGFAVAYLLLPAVEWLTLNEFHPVALACPLLLYAIWFLDEDRLLWFGVFAALAALTKEEVALAVACLGLWYAVTRRRWAAGAVVVGAGIAWSALAIGVVIPHFNHGSSSFYRRYGEVGGSPRGLLRTALHHPGRIASKATSARGLDYLAALGLPLALLFFAAPLVVLAALPDLALNLLSSTTTQTSIHFHYTGGILGPLVAAGVLGAGRLVRTRPSWTLPVAGVALAAAALGNVRLGAIADAARTRVTEHDRIAARALRLIPDDAVVTATNTLGAHLSARRRFLSFPIRAGATWIAADERHPGYLDRNDPVATARVLAQLRRDPRWKLVFDEDGVLVFRRVSPSS